MAESSLLGKRKKKLDSCPNPLFVRWLTEWAEDAASKGLKSQYTYSKALRSLKKYPLHLKTGKDCMFLENFGKGICKLLDKKLSENFADPGAVPSTAVMTCLASSKESSSSRTKTQMQQKKTQLNHASRTHTISSSEDSSCETDVTSPLKDLTSKVLENSRKANRSQGNEKDYIPAYRSGAFALLITLHRNQELAGSRGFMSKAELTREAEPLSETSFRILHPDSRYTAWSSMGTLIKKGLVMKESNPAKYSLTDAGSILAQKLEKVEFTTDADVPKRSEAFRDAVPAKPLDGDDVVVIGSRSSFSFRYISENGDPVFDWKQAATLTDTDGSKKILIRCRYISLLHSKIKHKLDFSRPLHKEFVHAYACHAELDDTWCLPILAGEEVIDADAENQHTGNTEQAPADGLRPQDPTCNPSFHRKSPEAGFSSQPVTDSQGGPSDPDFTLPPGTFDIVLCVDNCEYFGGSHGGSDFLSALIKNGVDCNLRKLQVGDFLWIAQERISSVPGLSDVAQRRELVLNYIIERKRMDDLVSSIIDGRFREQKFRLKHCGLHHPMYLIEEYGSSKHFSISEDKLKQAITNTQVIDGFLIKKTRDMKETVAFLTFMNRFLENSVKKKTLHGTNFKKLHNFQKQVSNSEETLMTFKEFNESSVKSKDLTVQEMFGKQLMQLDGMSASKAAAVVEQYPTPTKLFQAYSSCVTEKEKERLLCNIKCGKAKRNLGISQSRLIYQFYCSAG